MEELYSTVNKSQTTKTTRTTTEIKQPNVDVIQAFPPVNDGNLTYQHSTRNNETYHIDLSAAEQNENNNNNNNNNKRKESLEIYEHQQQQQQQPQIVPNHDTYLTENYTIKMQPSGPQNTLNWTNSDTYIHIFLTFFFGHFASFLFFDGILRNIENLIVFERPVFYIIFIIFSIAYLAFTVWMLTILWRWWRNKSLLPHDINYVPNVPLLKKQQKLIAQNYVFIAAVILAFGLLVYLAIGIIDNRVKYYHYNTVYYIDTIIFVIRLVLWFIAIIALLALNRRYFKDNVLPKSFKTTKKEPQTIVYEIRQ
jgi:hypothetical protein